MIIMGHMIIRSDMIIRLHLIIWFTRKSVQAHRHEDDRIVDLRPADAAALSEDDFDNVLKEQPQCTCRYRETNVEQVVHLRCHGPRERRNDDAVSIDADMIILVAESAHEAREPPCTYEENTLVLLDAAFDVVEDLIRKLIIPRPP